ncbi:MAG: hypothetical protein IT380_19390 [Myxococcales bacterium]|nr:hypothetical protein [Myxococcales bacterium]
MARAALVCTALALGGCSTRASVPEQASGRHDGLECAPWTVGDRLTVVPPVTEQPALPLTDVSSSSDGAHFLVAWARPFPPLGTDVVAVRLRPDGRPIDTSELRLTTPVGTREGVQATFDGTNYLVAWTELLDGGPSEVRTGRVSPSGQLLDPQGRIVSTSGQAQRRVAVASSGASTAVVWEQSLPDGGSEVRATRFSSSGQSLDPAGIVVAPGVTPTIAFGQTEYLVGWQTAPVEYDVLGNALTLGGALAWTTPRVLNPQVGGSPVSAPRLSYGAGLFLLSAYESPSSVRASRVSLQGQPLEAQNLNLSVTQADKGRRAVFNGSLFQLSVGPDDWVDVPPTGAPRYHVPMSMGTNSLSRSTNGTLGTGDQFGCGVRWGTDPQHDRVLTGFWVPPFGAAGCGGGHEWKVWSYPVGTDRPAIAEAQGRFLVAWQQANGPTYDVWGTLFGPGELTEARWPISTESGSQVLPAVASDGVNFLVVWEDHRNGQGDVFAARVGLDGGVLDPGGFAVAVEPAHQHAPAVAFDGTQFVVAWEDERGDGGSDIYAARVSTGGVVLDPAGFPVSSGPRDQYSPRLAPSTSGSLVVWQDYRSGALSDVFGTLLDRDAGVVEPMGLRLASTPAYRRAPAVGFDGTRNLVAYVESFDAGVGDVRVVLLTTADGGLTLGPTASLNTVSTQFTQPELSFDGRQFVVTWQATAVTGISYDRSADIRAARLSATGDVVDDGGLLVVDDFITHVPAASLASNDSGVSYVAFKSLTNRSIQAVAVRFPPYSLGLPCGCDSDCGSGWCVEGVCCDSACSRGAADSCLACTVARGALQAGHCSLRSAGTLCAYAPGACATNRLCTGASGDCPPAVVFPAGVTCRPSNQPVCDPAESCDGVNVDCPPDIVADAGTPCDDGRLCTVNDVCSWIYCTGDNRDCSGPCIDGYCDEPTGHCVQSARADGSRCVEPSTCSEGVCTTGTCDAGTTFACPPSSPCQVGACNARGDCEYSPAVDGTLCDDGDACTTGEVCAAGACVGASVCDAGTGDAGVADAGLADAGPGDAGRDDGGLEDAGPSDGGGGDGGTHDAGGEASDGGLPDGGVSEPGAGGCGCYGTSARGELWGAAFVSLFGALIRRKARRQKSVASPAS